MARAKTKIATEPTRKTRTVKQVQPDPVPEKQVFKKGSFYRLLHPLFVRKVPSGANKKMYELPVYLKMCCFQNQCGNAVIPAGINVQCIDIIDEGKVTWMIIPGGCICVTGISGDVFVEEV